MKGKRHTTEERIRILRKAEGGKGAQEICREHGISPSTYYQWKSKYGGLDASELKRIKELEAENAELKRMYAETSLERDALKKLLAKKLKGR